MTTLTRLRRAALVAIACSATLATAHADATRPTLVGVKAQLKGPDDFSTYTNQCIAKATSGAARDATADCTAAVKRAEIAALEARTSPFAVYLLPDAHATLALALSNRAVVHWLNGSAAAKTDIARAATLAPKSAYVQTNVVALAQPRVVTVAAR